MKNLLPQYYRSITARISAHFGRRARAYLLVFLAAEVVFFISLSAIGTYLTNAYLSIKKERRVELQALSTWEQLIKKHPTYPQTYYGAAVHALRLGDSTRAVEYLQKALSIDSGFEAAKKLRNEIK